jgi:hypothetical protein
MQEFELTAQRLASVWWLMLWRGWLGGLLVGILVGAIGGAVIGGAGHPELGAIGGYPSPARAGSWNVLDFGFASR